MRYYLIIYQIYKNEGKKSDNIERFEKYST